jgi:hypothetical protein
MAYSSFTFEQLEDIFGIDTRISSKNLFMDIPIEPSEWLKHSLQFSQKVPLLSEKARSEMIVMPILLEMIEKNNHSFSLFSGAVLDSDSKQGLNGECDYIYSKKPMSYQIAAPIFAVVEAKRNDIELGMPQCIAQMYGASIFNKKRGNQIPIIYGCVTTGEEWQFLRLEETNIVVDAQKYFIKEVPLILGAIQQIIDKIM